MLVLTLCWICWCTLHSLLITEKVHAWFRRQGGFLHGSARLFYTLFAFFTLLPLLYYQYSIPQEPVFSWEGWLRIPQSLLLLYALIMLIGGLRVYDFSHLVGLKQFRAWQQGKTLPQLPFYSQGMLRWVRHPWYSSGLVILWTVGPITDASLPARTVLSLYLIIGTLLEERKLRQDLGEVYVQYCQQVPMLFPWKGRVVLNLAQTSYENNHKQH